VTFFKKLSLKEMKLPRLFASLLIPGFLLCLQAAPASIPASLRTPLLFEAAGDHRFLVRQPGQNTFFAPASIQFHSPGAPVETMHFTGANRSLPVPESPSPARIHYLNSPIPYTLQPYERLRYPSLYPGVDMVVYSHGQQLEFDLLLEPHADLARVVIAFGAQARLSLDVAGNMLIVFPQSSLTLHKPHSLQGGRQVPSRFRLEGQQARLEAEYNPAEALTIDPALTYSTYIGGSSNDSLRAVATDPAGNIYVAGNAASQNLSPTTGALQTAFGGATSNYITGDAFVAKFSPSGVLQYLTYLGGSADDFATAIAVDASGSAYIAGQTTSSNFPVSSNAYQRTYSGGGGNQFSRLGDAFIVRLNPAGSQAIFSTFLGGTRDDIATAIALDAQGNVVVAGSTLSTNFPTTSGVVQTTFRGTGGQLNTDAGIPYYIAGDGFVTKLNAAGTQLIFSTYLGGSLDDNLLALALDPQGNIFVGGATLSTNFPVSTNAFRNSFLGVEEQNFFYHFGDGFLTKLNPTATQIIFSTYFGGEGDDSVSGLATDASGNAYLTGSTSSQSFPTTFGAFRRNFAGYIELPFLVENLVGDAFAAKFSPDGGTLIYSTYLGGVSNDGGTAIAVDASGNAYITGFTESFNFPTTVDGTQRAVAGNGGNKPFLQFGDAFLTMLNPAGNQLVFSTYLGGSLDDIAGALALDGLGNVVLAGNTVSRNFPVTSNAYRSTFAGFFDLTTLAKGDAFVSIFNGFPANPVTVDPQAPRLNAIVHGASNAQGAVSPGLIFVAYGVNLGPTNLSGAALASDGRLSPNISGVRILFDGTPAPIVYVSATQASAIVPYDTANKSSVNVVVENNGRRSPAFPLAITPSAPGLFSRDFSGRNQAVAFNQNNSVNSSSNPANPGDIVVLYGSGEGQTLPGGLDGRLADANTLPRPLQTVSATIGGLPAQVVYAGAVPGQTAGLFQVNLRIAADTASGNQPVVVRVGNTPSQTGLTIAVR
jgi:uncharacterized protein (TIGR03437 family)